MDKPDQNQPRRIRVTHHVTIMQRGKKRTWQADFHVNGRHCLQTLKTSNRRIAEQKARDIENLLQSETFATITKIGFSETIKRFIEKKKGSCTASTIGKYQHDLDTFHAFVQKKGIRHIRHITFRVFESYLDEIDNQGLAPYSRYCIGMNILAWLRWAKRQKFIEVNPLDGFEMVKPSRPEHPAATMDQIDAILARTSGLELAVIATAAFSGLRVGEIQALRMQDVNLDSKFITVTSQAEWSPKTAAGQRRVPIHSRLLAILIAYSASRSPNPEQTVFCIAPPSTRYEVGSRALERSWANTVLKRIATSLNFTVGREKLGLTFHALRRSFKSFALDAGVPGELVDNWVGHASGINRHYYRPNDKESLGWISKVPLGESTDEEICRAKGAIDES